MSGRILAGWGACLAALAAFAMGTGTAHAGFGLANGDVLFGTADGSVATQAGSHPYAFTTILSANTVAVPGGFLPDEEVKDLEINLPPGLVGAPHAVPRCSSEDFITLDPAPACPASTMIGKAKIEGGFGPWPVGGAQQPEAMVFNLAPPPGVASKIGFSVLGSPVTIETVVSERPPYNLITHVTNVPDVIQFIGATVTLWGVPGDPRHTDEKIACHGSCEAGLGEVPFLTLPRACSGPLTSSIVLDSWQHPGVWTAPFTSVTHNQAQPPEPLGMTGCEKLGFSPSITAAPTAKAASSPSGLDFGLGVHDEGITSAAGIAQSDIRKVEVTLPEGFSINPSQAEGLVSCSEADLARESHDSEPGSGCPGASKIGTVEVETPLLDESVDGALYVASPYENPFGSLVALYLVIKNEKLGIKIVQPLKVTPDPVTGRVSTVAEELPQLPFSHFRLHFREGARSPLSTPAACGTYPVNATLYPWSGGPPASSSSVFEIVSGPAAGPCPSGGTPPFRPGLLAGTINNAAGSYSPFDVRLTRTDSEQEITHFSIKLPPGVSGKLAGIPFCPDAAIAAAKAREGQPRGGQEEIERPSCPGASEVGHLLVGAGVGPALTYVPGKAYLAGPYHGNSLSIVAITAAKAGPFDLGTVVVREGLEVNPETAEVFVDATGSDPIPHIIRGIPVHLRDLRIHVDRRSFVLNPTNCEPTSTASTVLGSGTDFASEADDHPITVTTRFQAADCARLGYKPRLAVKLKGSPKRAANPALTAILRPRPGDANSKRISVALPHSEFLDQSHIKTICTRVQFKAGAGNGTECPAGSIYGHAKVWTPLLSEPLQGPVILRSSEHTLPDMVLALHGLINFDAVGRIDSVKGGIRNTFETVPDVPIEKVELRLGGGKKSLLENSTNLCKGKHKATAEYTAQSGRRGKYMVPLQAQCGKGGPHKKGAGAKQKGKGHKRSKTGRSR